MPPSASVEALTRRYGHDLFARLEGDSPLVLTPRWLDDRLMEWTMDDETIKVQLFRFIDVLPSILNTTPAVIRHLKEYLGKARDRLPGVMRWGLGWLPETGPLAGFVAAMARINSTRLARRFIAGSNVAEAVQAIVAMRRQNMTFTIDLLGEAILTEVEADHYQRLYLELVDGLTAMAASWPTIDQIDTDHLGPMPKVNISIKLSALYSQFDPIAPEATSSAVKERLRPILRLIKNRGAFVNIDMEQFAYKETTLRIFREVFEEPEFRDWPHVGIAIQAYLRSCGEDLRDLNAWVQRRGTPVWVRLVKGAYWDYETAISAQNGWTPPVFQQKWQSDENYETQTRFLMENHTRLRPAFGSHNIRSISHAMALADELNVPRGCIEFQLLYGMADPIKTALVQMGQRVRVYTPYGQLLPGMAYLVRRLLENTANQSFLRISFIEHVAEEQLLMNPAQHDHASVHAPSSNGAKPAGRSSSFRNEALTDFSQEVNRIAFAEALKRVQGQLGGTYPAIVNGQAIMTTAMIESVNPSHRRQVVGRSAAATAEHAQRAVQAAQAAFATWRDTPVAQRAECLKRAAALMRQRRHELAAWMVVECAKQWREADADVAEAIDFCEYYAQEMVKLDQTARNDLPGEENSYFYEPRGVAVVIAPWNFPLAIPCGMTVAALVTGNPTILKPAEQSPVIAAKLVEILHEAGVPKSVLHFLPGKGEEVGPVLVRHPEVAVIVFTGSRAVGLLINKQAAETPPNQPFVKRVITEMGGKNAVIVDADADLDEAVHAVIQGAFGFQGQKCSACSRAIVLEGQYDAFVRRVVEAAKSLKIGPAEDPSYSVGPVIDDEARQRILGFIEKAKQENTLAYAADVGSLVDEGFFVGPHIFTDVKPTDTIAQEEIFGPVLAVIRAKDLTEALQIANGTPYALTGGIHSRSPANLERVKREFRVGNLYINRKITGALVDRQPFGGFKLSGIGSKAGGPDYLLQFLLPRCVTENTMRHGFAPNVGSAASSH
jgi:RHH-type proline utilization regulon transcriptional repressor/proline dehydrogenase/delta 1-pyrroline-5-carboxylate dehydrogenase